MNVYLYGIGVYASEFLNYMDETKVHILGYLDSDMTKSGGRHRGLRISHISEIVNQDFDFIFIVSQYYEEIIMILKSYEIDEDKIKVIFLEDLKKCCTVLFEEYYLEKEYMKMLASEGPVNLILGDSRAYSGIDKNLLSNNWFNLSIHSQDLFFNLKFLEKICIETDKQIAKVILGLSNHHFNLELSLVKDSYVVNRYRKFGFDITEDKKLMFYEKILDRNLILNLKNMEEDLSHKSKIYNIFIDSATSQQRANIISSKYYPKSQQKNVDYLHQFINWCIEKQIKLKIIIFPLLPSFHENIDNSYLSSFNEKIYTLCNDYNIEIFDCSENHGLKSIFFCDGDHLNSLGATEFTKSLIEIGFF